ncbi:MAG: AsmA-like C-terminal region-containing protein [Gallionella sp.]|nr:AsmA-like C-terminal region-containing protein [Gallionella sp.]
MDNKILFVRTAKGEAEVANKTSLLFGDAKRALLMVDGNANFAEIGKRAAPSLRHLLVELFQELERGGFVQDKAKAGNAAKLIVPVKTGTPAKKPTEDAGEELDFTSFHRVPTAEVLAVEAAKLKAAADAAKFREQQETEQAETKRKQEAETARIRAEAEARAEAEKKALQKIEEAKLRVKQEAEAARLKAEQEVAKAREEAEQAKKRAAAEAKAREEAERQAKVAAEAARRHAEQEAAKVRAELEAAKAKAEQEAREREEAERRARAEAEAARLKAEQEAAKAREEAEQARLRAAAEAKARQEAERQAREVAEAARRQAEQDAAKVRAELEAAKAKAEQESREREEAERRARAEAEAARLKAEQEAAKAREEAEQARQRAVAEAKAREEAERQARDVAEAARRQAEQDAKAREEIERQAKAEFAAVHMEFEQEAARVREEAELSSREEVGGDELARQEADAALLKSTAEIVLAAPHIESMKPKAAADSHSRSTSATVLFFDVVGYTKQSVKKQIKIKRQFNQLLSELLDAQEDGERIILDTGDGAAIGFMQHPEVALEIAMLFRKAVIANDHKDYPGLDVRIGIHLGPISIVKDMNGQSNMVGDGINDAQRVMSFAGIDQIYISRPYYDFVSRLSEEYAALFQYRGAQKDKHGREHQVYELVDAAVQAAENAREAIRESGPEIKLEPFSFAGFDQVSTATVIPALPVEPPAKPQVDASLGIENFTQQKEPISEPAKGPVPEVQSESVAVSPAVKKPPVQSHMPTEEEVRKLAETQAYAWGQAEQRALESKQAALAQEAEPSVKPAVPHVRKSPLPWGKIGAGLFVLLLVGLFAVPAVLPTRGYANHWEQVLSEKLGQPVKIGGFTGRILPMPQVVLSDVALGTSAQMNARQVLVKFHPSALFSSVKPVSSLELDGVQVNGAAIMQVTHGLRQLAADMQYPVRRIVLSDGKLEADGVLLSGIAGELGFDASGKFAHANLSAEGKKISLDLAAASADKLQAAILVRGSALPLLPSWVFDELNAKGELTEKGLRITELDGRLMGGVLLGEVMLDWQSGWRAEGKLEAKVITLNNVSDLLEGDMDASGHFQMQAGTLSQLVDSARLSGTFAVKKGGIHGINIVETARLRSSENLPGGRTHFDNLSGELSYENGTYRFAQLKMGGGVLSANGSVSIRGEDVSGSISANLSMRAGMGAIPLQLGGTTESLTLRVAR